MVVVSVVGSIHMDFYIRLPKLPQQDETVVGYGFTMLPGGKGANQAVAAARLGAETYFIGRVGRDVFGSQLIDALKISKVNVDYITIDDTTHTGVAFILLNSSGENMIAVAPGTDHRISKDDVNRAADVIGRSNTVLLQLEIPLDTVVYAAKIGWRSGAHVILNPAPAIQLPEEVYKYVYAMTPNRVELSMLSGVKIEGFNDIIRAGRILIEKGVKYVVTTLGSDGSVVISEYGAVHVPAYKVKVVDTTGAGDVFSAALAVFIAEGMDIIDACRMANAAAALKITRMGAQSAPSREELIQFLKSYDMAEVVSR
ncbi:MAG: ribokinase [Ignisphaera sp.]|nr:ribokinase [Ignisphaera sp.]MCX8168554.1 ribokinase [Ignisphaera sp.]MDW8085140.1 ribokinase [Ignisphaera sp.]